MPLERGDLSKDSEKQAGKILRWFLFVIVCMIALFFVRWMMARLNYKLYEIRRSFWPTLFGILGFVILLVIFFLMAIRAANIYGKKKEEEEKSQQK